MNFNKRNEVYGQSYRLASDFLENKLWKEYWREPLKLFEALNWNVIAYKNKRKNLSEGYCYYKDNQIFIAYDDSITCKRRKTYTFHHEGGHAIGAHPIIASDIIHRSCQDKEKSLLEISATIIGRNVFLPAYVIDYLIKTSGASIRDVKEYFYDVFKVSYEYITVRFNLLKIDLKNMKYPLSVQDEAKKELKRFKMWYSKRNFKKFSAK